MRALLLLLLVALASPVHAADPDPSWTDAERWAWNEIVNGRIANFHARPGCTGPLNSQHSDDPGWTDPCRRLSARFLDAALPQKPWRDAIPRHGFRIEGARIADEVDLTNARIDAEVWLDASRFEAPLVLDRARFEGLLSIQGSTFEQGVRADSLHVRGPLFARNGTMIRGGRFDLIGARIDSNLELTGSTFERGVRAERSQTGGYLLARNTNAGGGDLDPRTGIASPALDLYNATVGSDLELHGSTFWERVRLERLSLRGDLFLNSGTHHQAPDLFGARIHGSLNVEAARLPGLKLAAASVEGELVLASSHGSAPTWTAPDALLDLRNATLGALADRPSPATANPAASGWAPRLDLQGTRYDRLGGSLDRADGTSMAARDPAWYTAWLALDRSPNPQPYRQLASVLRTGGRADVADAVLFAAREREREAAREAGDWERYIPLTLARILIGYGIGEGYWNILFAVGALTLLGAAILWRSPDARWRGFVWCFGASLDHLLPIIELNPEFSKYFDDPKRERLASWQLVYFAVHALVGYCLGIFVAAAFAGLTQTS